MGQRTFLRNGFRKWQPRWRSMLAYNMKRVMAIIGVAGLLQALAA